MKESDKTLFFLMCVIEDYPDETFIKNNHLNDYWIYKCRDEWRSLYIPELKINKFTSKKKAIDWCIEYWIENRT